MNATRWNGPFVGLLYFLTHPRMWGLPLLGILISGIVTFYATWKTLLWTAPQEYETWLPYVWKILQMLGWGSFTFVMMILFIWPLILNFCFLSVFNRELKRAGRTIQTESFWTSLVSSFGVFFRTIRWRILWPCLILLTILFIPIFTVPLSILAINHLAVLESADVALTALGQNGNERSSWIQSNGTDCLALAVSGSALNLILSITLVGWILWVPAIFCGTFLYLRKRIYTGAS